MRALVLVVLALAMAHPVAGLPVLPQEDDAGSGRDAPDEPRPYVRIARGVVYEGNTSVIDWDHYAFNATAGETFVFVVDGIMPCYDIANATGAVLDGECATATSSGILRWSAPSAGLYYLVVGSAMVDHYRFGIDIAPQELAPTLALDLEPSPTHPTRGNDPSCRTGAPLPTSGTGAELDRLVFAALKTGFRAVVAWHTPNLVAAHLDYSLDGGDEATIVEPTPRHEHVFVLDELPVGASLCFRPAAGAPHAIRLANAMNDRDPETGVHTANLLVVANTQLTRRADLEASLPRAADVLRDATDGHVRLGTTVLVYGDAERQHTGINACYLVVIDGPGCDHAADVVFTYDSCPGGSACTTLLGVKDPQYHVWMSSVWQANAAASIDDSGAVLAHELGHYLLGALDVYGPILASGDCWDPAKGLSIMGGNRDATELDDATNRCPNEAELSDYVPGWTLFREAYPGVPERPVIDEGPHGTGPAFSLHAFSAAPGFSGPEVDLGD